MAELPSGTVTFLFTDVAGSTRLWQDQAEAMKAALARHDEILRGVVVAHGGVVVKMTGDGVHAVFSDAADAVHAALQGQRMLGSETWPPTAPLLVRMGVHTGPAEARDGDYYGTAVNRAARLMSAAHGGQVLISLATQEHVRDAGADDFELLDLGATRLRDLARPERVFQLVASGIGRDFPALRSLDAFPSNLPVHLSSFVGREDDMRELGEALSGSRLVTLTGVGGVGKTRLATQVAAEIVPTFRDGAWLCELAAAADQESMAQVVANALGVVQRSARSLDESIVEFLRSREALLVLDNCEHLLDASARLAAAVVGNCPGVRILATSREGLAVEGERVVPVRSLALPTSSALEAAMASEAVRLFVERSEAARPGFVLDDHNSDAVAEICRRLDGIPLAIELAAARVGAMSAPEVAQRLDERFRLLTGGRRVAVGRHQTLRATIDWSYSLLSDTERAVFDRLGVFTGGFDVSAAQVVCAGHGVDAWDVLDALSSLVAKSMVTIDETGSATTRYELLETLRAYASAQLEAAGVSDALRRRHAEYYATFAEEASIGLTGPEETTWRTRFHGELANLRASVTWALETDNDADGELAVRIVAALAAESLSDHSAQVGAWAELTIPRARHSTSGRRTAVLAAAAAGAYVTGRTESARVFAEEATRDDIAAACPVPSFPYAILGAVEIQLGDVARAQDAITRGHAVLGPGVDHLWARAQLHATQNIFFTHAEDFPAARAESERAIELSKRLGNPTIQAISFGMLGFAAWRDAPDVARGALDESIALTHAGAGDVAFTYSLALVAPLRLRQGDRDGALDALVEALKYGSDNRDLIAANAAVGCMILVATSLGAHEGAAVLVGVIRGGPLLATAIPNAVYRIDLLDAIQRVRAELGEEVFAQSASTGTAMSLDEAIEYALALASQLREGNDHV
jgi:predicted ATPase/class 3 adenylate cyclase